MYHKICLQYHEPVAAIPCVSMITGSQAGAVSGLVGLIVFS